MEHSCWLPHTTQMLYTLVAGREVRQLRNHDALSATNMCQYKCLKMQLLCPVYVRIFNANVL